MKLSDLPVGSKIKFGKYAVEDESPQPIIWLIVDKNYYNKDEYNLITEKIIDLRAFDAREPNNPNNNNKKYGNTFYEQSNIFQWLNSDKKDWYNSKHEYDQFPSNDYITNNTPYNNHSGFLYNFTKEDKLLLNNHLVFLPSSIEITNGFSFFKENSLKSILTQQCFNNTLSDSKPSTINISWHYLLRSEYNSSNIHAIHQNGSLSQVYPCRGDCGIRPCISLYNDIIISDILDSDDCYNIIFPKTTKYINYKRS